MKSRFYATRSSFDKSAFPRKVFALLLVASASLHAATYTVTSNADTGAAGTLRWAIGQANANAGSTIQLNNNLGTITLTSFMPIISSAVTINGGTGNTVSGNDLYRIFLVSTTNSTDAVTIQNLTLANGLGKGGDGAASGGGGLGAGGALFVNKGAVTLSGVTLSGNTARGGNGGDGTLTNSGKEHGAGGGGGLGGNGGFGDSYDGGGGGGLYGNGGNVGNGFSNAGGGGGIYGTGGEGGNESGGAGGGFTNASSATPGTGGGTAGGYGGNGSNGGGGGGAGALTVGNGPTGGAGGTFGGGGGGAHGSVVNGDSYGTSGGNGGDLGGGGGAAGGQSDYGAPVGHAGNGGFGGGGGGVGPSGGVDDGLYAGAGGFGGGGGGANLVGYNGEGGTYGGDGGGYYLYLNNAPGPGSAGGGGGGGLGGAIFVRGENGASLTFSGSETGSQVIAGAAGASINPTTNTHVIQATDGQTAGGAIFLYSGTATFGTGMVANQIAGEGGVIRKTGTGTLTLKGNNTYSGGTSLEGGVLALGNSGALGTTGTISFTGGTLQFSSSNTTDYSSRFSTAASQQYKFDTNGQNVTVSANLTSAGGSLTKTGSGTLTVAALAANSGGTTISGGTLKLAYTGLSLWLEADKGVTVTGTRVTGWADLSGAGNNAGAASDSADVTKTTLSTGQAALNLPDNAYMEVAGLTSFRDKYTIFSVVELANYTGDRTILGSNFNNGLQFRISGTDLQVLKQGSTLLASSTTGLTSSGPLLVSAAVTGSSQALYSGQTLIGSGSTAYDPGAPGTFDIGAIRRFNQSLDGNVASILIFNEALSPAQIAQVQAYLQWKYFGGPASNFTFANALLATAPVNITASGAGLDLNGGIESIGSLTGVAGSAVYLGGAFLTVGSDNTSTTFAGNISDLGGASAYTGGTVLKVGSGTLTLSGSNSQTGGLIINQGKVNISSESSIGAASGTLALDGGTLHNTASMVAGQKVVLGANGGTFELGNGFLTLGAVSGSGALTKTMGNILTLTGAQTYTGSTSVQGGTLKIEAGSLASPSVNVAAGSTLLFNNGGAFDGNLTGSGTLSRSGSGVTVITGTVNNTGGISVESGTMQIGSEDRPGTVLNGSANIVTNGELVIDNFQSLTIAGVISGSGGLTNNGHDSIVLTANNTYTGTTTILSGILQLGNNGTTGSLGTGKVVNNDRLLFYRSDAITFANEITGTGMIRNFGAAVTLTGTNSFTGGLLLDIGQINFATDANLGDISGIVRLYSGVLHNTASLITARQIILGGGYGTLELGNGFLTLTTALTGDGGLRKTQGNILTLTGAQTYLGGTLVEGGMLKIESGSLATPSVDLAAGTVLNFNNGGGMSGSITGSGTFTRTGTGATIYTGDASHTGGTVVESGTLQIGVGGTTGSIAGAITNNDTLAFNRGDSSDFGGAITGTGGVLVSGSGTIHFTGGNSYGGTTTISRGTLLVGSGTQGSLGSGSVLDNGRLTFSRDDDITFANAISGTGIVQQNGAATLTLTGSNSYSGGTMINRGTLSVANDANLGAASGGITLDGGALRYGTDAVTARSFTLGAGGGTLDASNGFLTLTNAITGTGSLIKTGGNILTLFGANTYTGPTSLVAGTLKVEGSLASSAVVMTTGTLNFNNSGTVVGNISGVGALTRTGTGATVFTGTISKSGGATVASGTWQLGNGGTTGYSSTPLTISDGATLALNRSDSVSYNTAWTGSGRVVFLGSGTSTLTRSDQLYSGGTIISSGKVILNANNALGSGAIVNNARLVYNLTGPFAISSVISGSGSVENTSAFNVLTFTGSNSYSGGTIITNSGINFTTDANLGAISGAVTLNSGTLHNTASLVSDRNIVLGAGGGTIQLGSGFLTLNNAISGSGALTKADVNILTLTGAQTYTGSTSVQGGTLKVEAGSLASPTVDVASGARLLFDNGGSYAGAITGSGTFARSGSGVTAYTGTASHTGGTVVESGTLQLGNGLDNGALSGTVAIANGATFAVNRTGAPSTLANVLTGLGAFLKSGTGTLVLSSSNSFTGGATINAGTLGLGDKDALGSGLLTINGGGIRADGGERTLTNNLALNGSFTLGRLTNFSGSTTLGADITIMSANPDVSAATTSILSGVISGNHRLTFTTSLNPIGTIVLSGSNVFSGGTTIQSGTVKATNAFAMGGGAVTVDGGVFIVDTSSAIANEVILSGGSYQRVVTGNLAHAVDATSDLGRATSAEILGGSFATAATLTTSFAANSSALNDSMRISDVYSFMGTGTSTFVLQLTIDQVNATSYLGWLSGGQWVNAVTGNTGVNDILYIHGAYDGNMVLGHYGVDVANGTVWAVINHNSDFATVPEPSTWGLLIMGAACGLLLRRRSAVSGKA